MPGNLLDTDIYFPQINDKDQKEINKEVIDYLYMLQEQLRYSFGNLGIDNFNDTELDELSELITEPLYMALNDVNGNITDLAITAQGLDLRLSNAEGDITTVTAVAEGLMTRIENAEGDLTDLAVTAAGLMASVTDLNTGMSHTLRLGADGMTVYDADGNRVIISKGCLNLTGAITWTELSDSVEDYINTAYDNANSAWDAAGTVQSTVSGWMYQGTTYIDGNQLATDTVTASKLRGGTISLLNGYGTESAQFILGSTQYGATGLEIDTLSGGMRFLSRGNVYFGAWRGWGYDDQGKVTLLMADDYIAISTETFFPSNDGQTSLGRSTNRWSAVYASSGQIQTSDRDLKHSIEPLPEKYVDMVDGLEPVRYKYNDGTSGRYHVGFIAQDVKAVMDELGVDTAEFGGYVADVDENSNPIYMLRYEEFIGILWMKVRELTEKINVLEGKK